MSNHAVKLTAATRATFWHHDASVAAAAAYGERYKTRGFMKSAQAVLVAGLTIIAGCAALPPQIAKREGAVLVQGVRNSNSRVLIRAVDDSDVLWVRGYTLGSTAWLAPGSHAIDVMCEFSYSWGTKILPGGELGITVRPGEKYQLSGTVSADGKACDVRVDAHS